MFDMVAVDFNGAAWRRKRGEDQRRDSTIEEAFATANVPIPDGLHHSGDQVASPTNGPMQVWHIRMHGAFEINRDVLGIKPTDRSCHHEVWIHFLHVNARLVERVRATNATRQGQDRRAYAKKRCNPCDHV